MRQSRDISLTNVSRDVGEKRRVFKPPPPPPRKINHKYFCSDKNGKIKIVGLKLAKILAVNRNKSGRKSLAKKKKGKNIILLLTVVRKLSLDV